MGLRNADLGCSSVLRLQRLASLGTPTVPMEEAKELPGRQGSLKWFSETALKIELSSLHVGFCEDCARRRVEIVAWEPEKVAFVDRSSFEKAPLRVPC